MNETNAKSITGTRSCRKFRNRLWPFAEGIRLGGHAECSQKVPPLFTTGKGAEVLFKRLKRASYQPNACFTKGIVTGRCCAKAK